MMDKKTLRNDLILIGTVLVLALSAFLALLFLKKNNEKCIAKIYVQDTIVETIDLSKKEEKDYIIKGLKGDVKVHTKDGAIAVVDSGCPHQDCVNMGYVSKPGKPIICAYNAVCIVVEGASSSDVVVG